MFEWSTNQVYFIFSPNLHMMSCSILTYKPTDALEKGDIPLPKKQSFWIPYLSLSCVFFAGGSAFWVPWACQWLWDRSWAVKFWRDVILEEAAILFFASEEIGWLSRALACRQGYRDFFINTIGISIHTLYSTFFPQWLVSIYIRLKSQWL